MRPLAVTQFSDYRSRIERKGIEEHRKYIEAQMARAKETADAAERSRCLANAVAANGLLLRGMDVGFITERLNHQAVNEISNGIQTSEAFRSLMESSGEALAANGNVDALVRDLQDRDRSLSRAEAPSRAAIDVIRDVQVKARARTAQPRDYATLVAAHRLSSWEGQARAPDGKMVDVVRRDLNRELDGKALDEETERVLSDPDFKYVMRHERKESLNLNALRADGIALGQYPKRAEQLRARETELGGEAPAAPEKVSNGPRDNAEQRKTR